ncbi:MAG: hypothetical protein IH877_04940 [Gemmatimonadetes bacterium]|nr:hypothetical protein [Gemmatimonadota bacterium]
MANKIESAEKLAQELESCLGDNLRSLLLFGTALRGGFAPAHQDLNVLIILDDASTAALRPIQPALSAWAKKRNPVPLIFSEAGWKASTDVFPIEIEDMREAHRLIKGDDPFEELTTTRADLRQELEREVRGKLLQLRAEYATRAPDGKALTMLLIDSASTFFVLMRALVRLDGGEPAKDPAGLVEQASEIADLDKTAFEWVIQKISGATVKALKPYDVIGANYVDAIEELAAYVDAA